MKHVLMSTLRAFIEKRPGLDTRDYFDPQRPDPRGVEAYRSDARMVAKQRRDALAFLDHVERCQGISAADIIAAAQHAFSGRLSIKESPEGYTIHYTAGQYAPTEYRQAAAAVLFSAVWQYYRSDPDVLSADNAGAAMRAKMRRIFGRSISSHWYE